MKNTLDEGKHQYKTYLTFNMEGTYHEPINSVNRGGTEYGETSAPGRLEVEDWSLPLAVILLLV